MRTDELIDRLAGGLTPVRRARVPRRLALGLGAGVLVAGAVAHLSLALRPDLVAAIATAGFWIKLLYPAVLAAIAFRVVERLARPGAGAGAGWAVLLPVALVAGLAVAQLALAPPPAREALVMGHSAARCPWVILGLSLPILLGLVLALRGLAPTRLARAGAAAGLLAGAAAAWVYSVHCDETAMPFLALWYSLGIALSAVLGAALGRFVLRW